MPPAMSTDATANWGRFVAAFRFSLLQIIPRHADNFVLCVGHAQEADHKDDRCTAARQWEAVRGSRYARARASYQRFSEGGQDLVSCQPRAWTNASAKNR